MSNIATENTLNMFKYLSEIVKLGLKVYRNIEEHKEYIRFGNMLPQYEGVKFYNIINDEEYWISVYKQKLTVPPDLPEELRCWIELSDDPSKEPQIVNNRIINEEETFFEDDENRIELYFEYLDDWEKWAKEEKPKREAQSIYREFFELNQLLMYNEQLELVWGQGILLWEYDTHLIKYPVLTKKMLIRLEPQEGIISILPIEDSACKWEFDIFQDLDLPDLTEFKNKYGDMEGFHPNDKTSYLSAFKELLGRIFSEGELIEELIGNCGDKKLTTKRTPQLIDNWVLFVRKRQEDAVIKDINTFIDIMEKRNVNIPGSISSILSEKTDSPIYMEQQIIRDEWNSLIDKEILFPLNSNYEQIQIIEKLRNSDGVVVWGPPGTGKSHTIVNLICNYMAQGKRILVTSQKEQALRVLHDKIPDLLKPLCMNVLNDVTNSTELLNKAISYINDVVTKETHKNLSEDIERLENDIDNKKSELIKTQNIIKNLVSDQLQYILWNGKIYLPSELADLINENAGKHSWLVDEPGYEIKHIMFENKKAIEVIVDIPLTFEQINKFSEIRKQVIAYKDDLCKDFPDSGQLISAEEFRKCVEDLRNAFRIGCEIENILPEIVFKNSITGCITADVQNDIEEIITNFDKAIKSYYKINEEWQKEVLNMMRLSDVNNVKIIQAVCMFNEEVEKLTELYSSLNIMSSYVLPENITLSELKTFVVQVLDKLDSGRKAYGILDFNVKRKKALMEIKIGGNPPTSYEDWRSIKIYLDLLISEESNLDKLNAFFGNLQVKCDIEKVGSYIDKYNLICTVVSKLNDVVTYQKDLLPDLAAGLSKIIEGDIDNIINAKEEKLEKYYTKICMKYKEIKLREAEKRVNHLHNLLINYADKINCHPTVYILLECFDKIYTNEDKIFGLWKECYCFINKLNELKPKYEELSFFVKQLSEYMPNWASKWLDKNVLEEELYPEYWMESVQFKTLQKYIHDINNKAYEISKCEKRLEELTKSIKGAKLELIVAKTKLGLLRIPDRQIEALKSWRLAVRRLGKGTGKWAWKNIKIAQEKMIEAKDAVPVWIMPLYKVSEVITSQFGSFDIVIIDEASQCDIRGLLALARGKKAVIVGDPQQISPSAVGISDAEVERLIREFLNGIPNKEHFNLKNSLYDIAEMKFTRQGTLMLKEHFRCIPEIIQFCNNLCYDNQIIPLRNVSESQRLEPVLESFFVKDGYREGGSDVNKPEAKAICERIKSIVNDRKYKEKTIGVITLQGNDQAKYIWKEINQYIDTEKQEEYKIRVGDPYNFQGDERDIIILSMVVSGNDSKNVYSLTSETYKQRFNVAVSRAKDKLILFHSIQIRDLNPVDLRFQLLNYIQNKQRDREDDDRKIEKLESPFEMEVYKWLTARGYKVEPQVKVGNCRIDMVVEGEKARLAVECDGDKYHLPEKWWEDRMRQRQLERAGWTFWRVWGSDFYKDKEAAMLPILDVLKDKGIRPVNKNNMSEENLHNNEIVNDKDYISRTHKKADLSIRNSLEEDLMEPKRKNLNRRNNLNFNWIESIEKVIIEILNESTKGKDLLPDEVMRKIEFSKRGDERSKMIKRINRVINKMIREGKIEEYSTEKRKRLRIKK